MSFDVSSLETQKSDRLVYNVMTFEMFYQEKASVTWDQPSAFLLSPVLLHFVKP